MITQTTEIVPADRKLYALRDVTGTVESIPLLATSIMSKKLAEGLDGLVLDVKTGSGSFLPQLDRSLELARTMIALGETRGCRTVALLTAMDRPLGRACGNALEVEALEMLGKIIEAQGGDPGVIEDPGILPQADAVEVFRAPVGGTVAEVNPYTIGMAIIELGGGRQIMSDPIDHGVGFVITVKPGDEVTARQPLASVFARDDAGISLGLDALRRAIVIGDEGRLLPLISHRVTAAGTQVL